jgi:hypothetical protein
MVTKIVLRCTDDVDVRSAATGLDRRVTLEEPLGDDGQLKRTQESKVLLWDRLPLGHGGFLKALSDLTLPTGKRNRSNKASWFPFSAMYRVGNGFLPTGQARLAKQFGTTIDVADDVDSLIRPGY